MTSSLKGSGFKYQGMAAVCMCVELMVCCLTSNYGVCCVELMLSGVCCVASYGVKWCLQFV